MSDSFPTDIEEFDADERISFSRLDNKFIAVHDDGSEYEFNSDQQRWIATDGNDEIEELEFDGLEEPTLATRKRKNGSAQGGSQKKQKNPPVPKQNTAVYVTGLPSDVTVDEVHELFARKAGVIAEEIDSKAPRIKLYNDTDGNFKGDALIVFFKPQSVEIAIMLLDDTFFRFNASATSEGKMHVQAADLGYKKVQYNQEGEDGSNGTAAPKKEANRQPKSQDARKKIIKKTQKLDAKLADWDDDDPYAQQDLGTKWDRTVILTQMFTLRELEEDPAALLEIKEDVREECEKLGAVTNVVLFDKEAEGIVSVKFKDTEAASQCIKVMHGRNFDGRKVEAFLATGRETFEKTRGDDVADDGDD